MSIINPSHVGIAVEYGKIFPNHQPPRRTAGGGKVPEHATYYPSTLTCIPVDLCGVKLNASHDFMANCHENRHFLDVALWKELKEGNPDLGEATAPHPPCKRLQAHMEEKVQNSLQNSSGGKFCSFTHQ